MTTQLDTQALEAAHDDLSDVQVKPLPCPFCGNAERIRIKKPLVGGDGGEPFYWGFVVICSAAGFDDDASRGCGATSGWGETEDEAIAAWNRRSPIPEPTKQEPVAWRIRERPGFPWHFTDYNPARMPNVRGFEREPLYTHPSSAPSAPVAKVGDGATDAERVLATLPAGEFHTSLMQQPEGMPRKDFFNALSYLVRRGDLERLGYGRYRLRALKPTEAERG